jgi:four helix bundle protein
MNKNDLLDRLIDFAVLIIDISKVMHYNKASITMINQILRSGTSPALNYGEAIGAESKKDFMHKIQISLKELRETFVSLKIIKKANLSKDETIINKALDECNQLISIFVKSINTSKMNK